MPTRDDKAQLRELQRQAIEVARQNGGLMIYIGAHNQRPGVRYVCVQCKRANDLARDPGASNLRCPDCEPDG
ncbi:MAG: hypothetical protein H7124_08990 [Phycisphaerales bacterium]|nr:hypothetical protein [Hyphomonadaceae bacterium]